MQIVVWHFSCIHIPPDFRGCWNRANITSVKQAGKTLVAGFSPEREITTAAIREINTDHRRGQQGTATDPVTRGPVPVMPPVPSQHHHQHSGTTVLTAAVCCWGVVGKRGGRESRGR
ncbi:hypothetical protein BaRGS_00009537 [Batillaria attramentaria]|uniref:Uncharacterized protein n=1 Tax=Batillaria attramentaria TaxID=370345 RepID=A0ABD0LIB2_9CAEN